MCFGLLQGAQYIISWKNVRFSSKSMQILSFQILARTRRNAYFYCVFCMFDKSFKSVAELSQNRSKIDEKSPKIDPRSSKLALRNALAGRGKLSEPPRWSPNASRCAQDGATCVQGGPTSHSLSPKLDFQGPTPPPQNLGRRVSRLDLPMGF